MKEICKLVGNLLWLDKKKLAFLKEEKDTVEPRLSGLVWT